MISNLGMATERQGNMTSNLERALRGLLGMAEEAATLATDQPEAAPVAAPQQPAAPVAAPQQPAAPVAAAAQATPEVAPQQPSPVGPPATAAEAGAFTLEEIGGMTDEQINANWAAISEVLTAQ